MSTWKRRPNESSAKRSMVIPKKPPSVTHGNNAGSPPRLRGKGCGVRTWASHARRRLTAYGTGKFLLGELSGEVPSRRWPESTSTIRPFHNRNRKMHVTGGRSDATSGPLYRSPLESLPNGASSVRSCEIRKRRQLERLWLVLDILIRAHGNGYRYPRSTFCGVN